MAPKKQDAASALEDSYNALVIKGNIIDDPEQRRVVLRLGALIGQLGGPGRQRGIGRFFRAAAKAPAIKGIYIWGSVGRGKSMLMDLFFEHAPVEKKRRVHFHAFMQEVHARIHQFRQSHALNKTGADPVMALAHEIAEGTSLLCFDELQATDVTDATLLFRLFDYLFEHGVMVVSTSNHPPKSLYTGGVQAERFEKFIALIESHMEVLPLQSEQDYRYVQGLTDERLYCYPLGFGADRFIEQWIRNHCRNPHPAKASLTVLGRHLPFLLYDGQIGRFTFAELCQEALGPADFLAIARQLRVLILTDIPRLSPEKRNEAKRFVTLIDALYEHKVKLVATAETRPEAIYTDGDGAFEFQRTVSRLIEMQSEKWNG